MQSIMDENTMKGSNKRRRSKRLTCNLDKSLLTGLHDIADSKREPLTEVKILSDEEELKDSQIKYLELKTAECDASVASLHTSSTLITTQSQSIMDKFEQYLSSVIGHEMFGMVKVDVLSKADPDSSFESLEMMVTQYLQTDQNSQPNNTEPPKIKKPRRSSFRRTADREIVESAASLILSPPDASSSQSMIDSSYCKVNSRRRSKRIRKSLAVYREQGTLPSHIRRQATDDHIDDKTGDKGGCGSGAGEYESAMMRSMVRCEDTVTPVHDTSDDAVIASTDKPCLESPPHLYCDSPVSDIKHAVSVTDETALDDEGRDMSPVQYTEHSVGGVGLFERSHEVGSDRDSSPSSGSAALDSGSASLDSGSASGSAALDSRSPSVLELGMLLESNSSALSLNDTFTIDCETESLSPAADKTFEISEMGGDSLEMGGDSREMGGDSLEMGGDSPELTRELECLYTNRDYCLPQPQPLSTIFEAPRKWRGEHILFSKAAQYRQYDYTEGCWYRVPSSKVNERKRRAKKNGWVAKSDTQRVRYDVLLEHAIEKLDETLIQDDMFPLS